jgi:dynein heavy chain
MMNNPERFLESLKSYKHEIDGQKVPRQNIDASKKTVASIGNDFTAEVMKKKSSAATGLCEWVRDIIKYYDVLAETEPKKIALAEANETLAQATRKLQEVNELVAQLEAQLAALMAEFDQAMADKDAVMAEAKRCENKLDMAQRLINALSANGIIWEQTVVIVEQDLITLPGEVLVGCAFASYFGVFTRDYREATNKEFCNYLREKEVPINKNVDPLKILCTDAEIALWNTQGLPSDRVSAENGAIMSNSERWCLIIDPQQQGILWIKNKENKNGLQITRLGHAKMVATFEQSIEQGKPVLLQTWERILMQFCNLSLPEM